MVKPGFGKSSDAEIEETTPDISGSLRSSVLERLEDIDMGLRQAITELDYYLERLYTK